MQRVFASAFDGLFRFAIAALPLVAFSATQRDGLVSLSVASLGLLYWHWKTYEEHAKGKDKRLMRGCVLAGFCSILSIVWNLWSLMGNHPWDIAVTSVAGILYCAAIIPIGAQVYVVFRSDAPKEG